MGDDLSMNMVKVFMERQWNFIHLPDLYYHDDGYFLMRFKSHEDKEAVLVKGPYSIRGMPMVLKEWKPDFNMKQDMMRTMPIWIKLPKLPLYLWGERTLDKIGSAIGVPMVTDECTTHKLRVTYARMLVEVDITRKLVEEIALKDKEGKILMQPVQYEWKPKFCDKCQKVGHHYGLGPKKNFWKPKQPKGLVKVDPPIADSVKDNNHSIQVTADQNVAEVTTPTNIILKSRITVEEDEIWTKAKSTVRDRGKLPDHSESSTEVLCSNGFRVLEVLNGPQALDRGPC